MFGLKVSSKVSKSAWGPKSVEMHQWLMLTLQPASLVTMPLEVLLVLPANCLPEP